MIITKRFALIFIAQGLFNRCAAPSEVPTTDYGRDALKHIVQDECLLHWRLQQLASPCEEVALSDTDTGYAILADRKGGAHFLFIPIKTLSGIESTELRGDSPNYFKSAWRSRAYLEKKIHGALPHDAVALAINPATRRSQDQFHIHMECIQPYVRALLDSHLTELSDQWHPMNIGYHTYFVRRIMDADFESVDPIQLVESYMPQSGFAMRRVTIVVIGYTFDKGRGFVILTSYDVAGELLLDSRCDVIQHLMR